VCLGVRVCQTKSPISVACALSSFRRQHTPQGSSQKRRSEALRPAAVSGKFSVEPAIGAPATIVNSPNGDFNAEPENCCSIEGSILHETMGLKTRHLRVGLKSPR
jgi:hypothetical protein